MTLVGEVFRHREDPRVVVPEPESGRKDLRVDMIQLHARGAAEVPYGQFDIQAPMLDPEVIEVPEGLAGEIPQLRMVTLRFQLGDDDNRQHHVMLIESRERCGVCEQDARVEDVGTVHRVGHAYSPGRRLLPALRTGHAASPVYAQGQTCRLDRGCPPERAAPALSSHVSTSGGLPRGRPGEPPATSEGTRDRVVI